MVRLLLARDGPVRARVRVLRPPHRRRRGQIDDIIDGPDYKHASWGIVADAKTGETVHSHNPILLARRFTKLWPFPHTSADATQKPRCTGAGCS